MSTTLDREVSDILTAAIVTPALLRLASEWHGGQTSALYSLASTGRVWSWDHAENLSDELADAHHETPRGTAERLELARAIGVIVDILSANPYAPGGILAATVPGPWSYALLALTDDGDIICERCMVDPANPVHPHAVHMSGDGWGIVGFDCSANLDELTYCANCGRDIG